MVAVPERLVVAHASLASASTLLPPATTRV